MANPNPRDKRNARAEAGGAIEKVGPASLANFIENDTSTASMASHRIIPRLKILQGLSPERLKKQFGEGATIISPGDTLIAEPEGKFYLVPLFFFEEFLTWGDRRDTGNMALRARSFNPTSEVGKKARDARLREEEYPGGPAAKPFKMIHTHCLTFASIIYGDHEQAGTCVSLTFQRGEFTKGRSFISAITSRRYNMKQAPLWSTVWEFSVSTRERSGNRWNGFDFCAPSEISPFIKDEEVAMFHEEHQKLKVAYEAQLLVTDYTEEDDPSADGSASEGSEAANKF